MHVLNRVMSLDEAVQRGYLRISTEQEDQASSLTSVTDDEMDLSYEEHVLTSRVRDEKPIKAEETRVVVQTAGKGAVVAVPKPSKSQSEEVEEYTQEVDGGEEKIKKWKHHVSNLKTFGGIMI